MDLEKQLADLRAALREKKIIHYLLAKKLAMSEHRFAKLIRGRVPPQPGELERIFVAVGLNVSSKRRVAADRKAA